MSGKLVYLERCVGWSSFTKQQGVQHMSSNYPTPISPVKWKDYSITHHVNPSSVPPSRSSMHQKNGLSPQKKEMMEDLKVREENRATRFRMRGILIQELSVKMGPKYKKDIPHYVDKLLSRKKNITNEDLIELEELIRGICKRPTTVSTAAPTNLDLSRVVSADTQLLPPLDSGEKSKPLTPLPLGTEWEQLTLFQTLEYDRQAKEAEQKKFEAKKALAAQLAEQVAEGRARREKERADDKAYADSIQRDVQRYREETNTLLWRKQQENTIKQQNFKDEIAMVRARKNEQRELAALETKQEMERIQAGLDYEQKLLRDKKEREAKIHRETVAENEENNRRKMLQRQREHEEEARRNQSNDDRRQAEEQARQEAFRKRMEKIEKNTLLLASTELNPKKEEEAPEFGQFSWDDGNEAQRMQMKHEKMQKIKLENLSISKQRTISKREERLKDYEDGAKLKEDTLKYLESEKGKKLQEQEKRMKYRLSLEQQIEENHHLAAQCAMTRPEKSVNQKELKMIQTDPNLHSRIAHRLRMKTAPGTAREKSLVVLTRPF